MHKSYNTLSLSLSLRKKKLKCSYQFGSLSASEQAICGKSGKQCIRNNTLHSNKKCYRTARTQVQMNDYAREGTIMVRYNDKKHTYGRKCEPLAKRGAQRNIITALNSKQLYTFFSCFFCFPHEIILA